MTPSCKMEPVIICSFGAHQALPSLSNTALLTSLPVFRPLPPLLSSCSHLLFHLPAYFCLSWHLLLVGTIVLTFAILALLLATLFLLNASTGYLRKNYPEEKKS